MSRGRQSSLCPPRIEFASVEKNQAWYDSVEYTELRKIRQRSAKTDVYLIERVLQKGWNEHGPIFIRDHV
ncbi:DUF1330 domain-containing protein [Pseudomonas germanica]